MRLLKALSVAGLLLALAGCGPAHRHLKMTLGEGGRFELTDEFKVEGPADLEYESDPRFLYESPEPEPPAADDDP